jgi:hypothetical protein
MPVTSIQPGWYPDPDGNPAERYWDGGLWTEQTRPVTPVTSPMMNPPALAPSVNARESAQRPISVAAIASVIPLLWGNIGLICAIASMYSTRDSGDRKGRQIARIGLGLNIAYLAFLLVRVTVFFFDVYQEFRFSSTYIFIFTLDPISTYSVLWAFPTS